MGTSTRDMAHAAQLEIRAAMADVRVASRWMQQFGEQHQVPADQLERLDICLNEALANVISYGDEAALAEPVQLHMLVTHEAAEGRASVCVTDAGAEFDGASAALGPRPASLADAEPGGLGLLMMRSFSDSLSYQRLQGRNELRFSVHWPRAND